MLWLPTSAATSGVPGRIAASWAAHNCASVRTNASASMMPVLGD
jgi:hypothetical protein